VISVTSSSLRLSGPAEELSFLEFPNTGTVQTALDPSTSTSSGQRGLMQDPTTGSLVDPSSYAAQAAAASTAASPTTSAAATTTGAATTAT
jgi:hypothetical protein